MKILDLYCGAGGAALGYAAAGFEVVGVDNEPQPSYPFEFVQADALVYLSRYGREYDAFHASPPCQAHTTLRHRTGRVYVDYIAATRDLLRRSGRPWAIENVVGAPLLDPIILCGSMFGLRSGDRWLKRHRLFESNVDLGAAPPDNCRGKLIGGVYGTGGSGPMTRGFKFHLPDAREAMGLPNLSKKELSQAIPPAYAQWVGARLLASAQESAA